MKIPIFWYITLCGPLKIFRGTFRLQLQARKIGQERNRREGRSDHMDGGDMLVFNGTHGVISHIL
jgi:hypothetical protein